MNQQAKGIKGGALSAPIQGRGVLIDGSQVRFWSLKRDAINTAKAIGWQAKDVLPVRTRFCAGFAIHQPGIGGFISRERYGELFHSRQSSSSSDLNPGSK